MGLPAWQETSQPTSVSSSYLKSIQGVQRQANPLLWRITSLRLHFSRSECSNAATSATYIVSTVFVDGYNPPKQHLLILNLPKSITVATTIKAIIDERRRLVQGDISCQYLPKCTALNSMFQQETAPVHYAYVQECVQYDDIPLLTPVLLKDALECLGLTVPEVINRDD
eukprot:TsM_000870200 transcript=TsM_000870200 gene=TsM_000870200